MRVRMVTLGCRLNEAESAAWLRQLQSLGYTLAAPAEPAELAIVNTCAVTHEAARKSRQAVRRLRRQHPESFLIATGCAVTVGEVGPHTARIELTVPNRDKDHLVTRALAVGQLPVGIGPSTVPPAPARVFLKVQDGCRHQCSFCVTVRARGMERSRTPEEIIADTRALVAAGAREIILSGVHLAGYGADLGTDLGTLLNRLLRDTEVPRIRLGSVEPWGLDERFWALFADPRLMPHLHLPLQSGADSVLRRMGRRCRTGHFSRLVAQARAAMPELNLGTDIIVGFPGETASEWRQTMEYVAAIGFGQVHIFPYSPRPGTRAAVLPDPVDAATQAARVRQLHELAATLRHQTLVKHVGRTVTVLVEGRHPETAEWFGYTPHYLPLRLQTTARPVTVGALLPVAVTGLTSAGEALSGSVAPRG